MDELAQNQEFFTLAGTLLGAVASLVTIAIAIGEALKPSRLDRRVARLNRMLEHEKCPNRVAALIEKREELEAWLFAREQIPNNQYVLWIFAMLLPFTNWLFSVSDEPSLWAKVIISITVLIISYQMVGALLNGLLQRHIVGARYLFRQNPLEALPDTNKYEFTQRWIGKFYAGLVACYASIVLLMFMISWWDERGFLESILSALGIAALYTATAFMIKQDIEKYMTKIAAEYIYEWSEHSKRVNA